MSAEDDLMEMECTSAVSVARSALDLFDLERKEECARAVTRTLAALDSLKKYPRHKKRVRMAIVAVESCMDVILGRNKVVLRDDSEYEIVETAEEAKARRIATARRATDRALRKY